MMSASEKKMSHASYEPNCNYKKMMTVFNDIRIYFIDFLM